MVEFLEERFEDVLMLMLIFVSFLSLMLSSTYIPPPYGQAVGTFLYLFIILGGVVFSDVYARYVSSQYPYLQIIVRPSNKTIHAFVNKDQTLDRRIGENTYTLHLRLANPIKYEDYGRVRELIIHHTGRLADKLYFRPGWCVWKGIRTRHPQTEIIEVWQAERATTSIDHGQPIPVFYLIHGSKDALHYTTSQVPMTIGNPSVDVSEYLRRIASLEAELAKVRRDAIEWQQRALAAEEIIGQQRAETAGLLEAKTGIKEHALELMLGFRQACVKPDTLIPGDYKPISQIGVGEHVLGRSGFVEVKQVFNRPYNGDIYLIKAAGLLPIEVTPEHPILVVRGRYRHTCKVIFDKPRWSLPAELKPKQGKQKGWKNMHGDYLVLPKPPKNLEISKLNLSNYTTPRGAKLASKKWHGYEIPLNKELAWLLGLYVAEGNCTVRGVDFNFGVHEKELIEKCISAIKSLGYKPRIHLKNASDICVILQSRILSRAFKDWCGHKAPNKRVPQFIMYNASDEIVKAFLEAVEAGDGYFNKTSQAFDITTTSKTLALQLQLLYLRFNVFASILEIKREGYHTIQGRRVYVHDCYALRIPLNPDEKRMRTKIFKDYALVPIRKIEIKHYNGNVYNLETSDGTFLVSNAVVHNCASFDRAIESLRGNKFRFTFSKWVALTIIGVAFIIYLWANPGVAYEIGAWFRNPLNSFIVLILIIAIVAIMFMRGRRK